jgi:hypothetical protein
MVGKIVYWGSQNWKRSGEVINITGDTLHVLSDNNKVWLVNINQIKKGK